MTPYYPPGGKEVRIKELEAQNKALLAERDSKDAEIERLKEQARLREVDYGDEVNRCMEAEAERDSLKAENERLKRAEAFVRLLASKDSQPSANPEEDYEELVSDPDFWTTDYAHAMNKLAEVMDLDQRAKKAEAQVADLRARLERTEIALLLRGVSGAPCDLCGYNGEGYYQPETHDCIGRAELARKQARSDEAEHELAEARRKLEER